MLFIFMKVFNVKVFQGKRKGKGKGKGLHNGLQNDSKKRDYWLQQTDILALHHKIC
jgi:hypothetical protein